MLCYTIRDTGSVSGIQPVEHNGDLFIKVGVDQVLKEGGYEPTITRPMGIPLGKTKRDQIYQLITELELPALPRINNVSLSSDGLRLVDEQGYCPKCWGILSTIHTKEADEFFCSGCRKQTKFSFQDRLALVLATPTTQNNVKIYYTNRTWSADFSKNRLRRNYNVFPPPGVETLLTGLGPNDEPWGLFIMSPKSGFRIVYTNRYRDSDLIVDWNGIDLMCRPHGNQRGRAA